VRNWCGVELAAHVARRQCSGSRISNEHRIAAPHWFTLNCSSEDLIQVVGELEAAEPNRPMTRWCGVLEPRVTRAIVVPTQVPTRIAGAGPARGAARSG